MTQAAIQKPRARLIRRERLIIERPRLLEKLDACDARTILLLAPAGYGKTTLARQWGRTLSRVVWVSLTSAHRDVTVLARDLAHSLEGLGDDGFVDFMDQYLRARQNPQREARDIGRVIAESLTRARAQWIVLDDYHELAQTPDAEALVDRLRAHERTRLLVASRVRPEWAKRRLSVYGEVAELGRGDLAMNREESTLVVGRRDPRVKELVATAHGWPAVLALAATLDVSELPHGALPDTLHRFLAEELFASVSPETQELLTRLALLPTSMASSPSEERLPPDVELILGPDRVLHPLLREFLLAKLAATPDGRARAEEAVARCLDAEEWQHAFDLILRFGLTDLVEPAVERAYRPLTRTGRIWTLSQFGDALRPMLDRPSPVLDVVAAEAANCGGLFDLAIQLAERALRTLPESHSLKACAALTLGACSFLGLGDFAAASAVIPVAESAAVDDRDRAESAFWGFNVHTFAEVQPDHRPLLVLEARRDLSATDLVRYGMCVAAEQHLTCGPRIDALMHECLHALPEVRDPRTATSLLFNCAYAHALQSRYDEALELVATLDSKVTSFDLAFVRPFVEWAHAFVNLGLRRFGETARALQRAQESIKHHYVAFHDLNIRALRSRMFLQTDRHAEALQLVEPPPPAETFPSMRAEYVGTRSLVLAVLGERGAAVRAAHEAEAMSTVTEARVYAAAAKAIAAGKSGGVAAIASAFELASSLQTWDPLVCALRADRSFAQRAGECTNLRPVLERLYARTNDRGLARESQLRIQATSRTGELSPRETEILGLIAQGLRNAQIARALFISESTVKVHVRHIFEKLGVRTRAEAAAR